MFDNGGLLTGRTTNRPTLSTLEGVVGSQLKGPLTNREALNAYP